MYRIYLVVPPGLEKVAIQEVNQLFPDLKATSLGDVVGDAGLENLEFECDLQTLYKLNLQLRVPNRILVRFAEFHTTSFQDLFSKSVKLPWKQYLKKDVKIAIRTTCHKSKLYHSGAVTQRIHQSIEANLGKKIPLIKSESEEIKGNHQLIIVRLLHDKLTISIDSSGNPLYMRGYRELVSKAPIRENLAAGMLIASGWTPDQPLFDPFCGSGTIPIEAALMACNRPPGLFRDFGFENWPGFHQTEWQELRKEHKENSIDISAQIFGSDRDHGTIEIAKKNAEKAAVKNLIHWQQLSISGIKGNNKPGWIITNPPYGIRISSSQDIRNLYSQLGNKVRQDFQGWNILFLSNNFHLATQTKLKIKSLLSFSNGGVNVQAFHAYID